MIAVVKYNAGNIHSVMNALQRLGVEAELTDDPERLARADKVIFPGVGEAASAMNYLRSRQLDKVLRSMTQPFLGICLGQQLMCAFSEEGNTECLGIFPEHVRHFPPGDKVPHMGWNNFESVDGALFRGIPPVADMYYVHSYYVETGPDTIATTQYIQLFSSAIHRDNFFAVQFHPEKSSHFGNRLIENFLAL